MAMRRVQGTIVEAVFPSVIQQRLPSPLNSACLQCGWTMLLFLLVDDFLAHVAYTLRCPGAGLPTQLGGGTLVPLRSFVWRTFRVEIGTLVK